MSKHEARITAAYEAERKALDALDGDLASAYCAEMAPRIDELAALLAKHGWVYDPEPRITTFTLGRDSFGSPRHAAICDWLKENGFDINIVPMDALVTISGDRLTIDVFDGKPTRHLTQQTVTLVSEPSALVRGVRPDTPSNAQLGLDNSVV